jgi:hypothetical protein
MINQDDYIRESLEVSNKLLSEVVKSLQDINKTLIVLTQKPVFVPRKRVVTST